MLLTEARQLLESRGAQVVALAVLVYQPTPQTRSFGSLPLYYLAKLDATYYADAGACDFCRRNVPLHQVTIARHVQVHEELVTASSL
jgi:orotate phosphoribosyltransferase